MSLFLLFGIQISFFKLHLCRYVWTVCAYHIFPRYLINGTNFRGKLLNENVCFDFLSNFATFLFLRLVHWDVINAHSSSCKVQFILVLMKFRFSRHILEKTRVLNAVNIRLVGAGVFLAVGWTDGQTWRSWQSLFAVLQGRLKTWIKRNAIILSSNIVR